MPSSLTKFKNKARRYFFLFFHLACYPILITEKKLMILSSKKHVIIIINVTTIAIIIAIVLGLVFLRLKVIDTTPPAVVIYSPEAQGIYYSQFQNLRIEATDDVAVETIWYSLNRDDNITYYSMVSLAFAKE